jgi:WD40 repeat protein
LLAVAIEKEGAHTVQLYNLDVSNWQRPEVILSGHDAPVKETGFLPDGERMLSLTDSKIHLWKLDGTLIRAFGAGSGQFSLASVAISADGGLLATINVIGNLIRLWDTETGEPLNTLQGHDRAVRAVAFAPDGTYLVSGGTDGLVRFWGLAIIPFML